MQGRILERGDRKKKYERENKAMLVFRYNTPPGIELSLSNTTSCSALLQYAFRFSTYVMTGKKNYLLTSPLLLTLPPSLPRHGEERVNFNLAIPGNAIKR